MKNIVPILALCLLGQISSLYSQGDGVVVAAAVAVGHAAEVSMLRSVKAQEEKIAAQQLAITATTGALLAIETKIYEGLTQVQSIITNATVVLQIGKEGERIVSLSQDIIDKLADEPELTPIVLNEVNGLLQDQGLELAKMTIALTGGEVNLMNNKERLEIMENLLNQLRSITTELYGINRVLDVAEWSDIFNAGDQFLIDSGVDYDAIFSASLNTLNELRILQDFSTQE